MYLKVFIFGHHCIKIGHFLRRQFQVIFRNLLLYQYLTFSAQFLLNNCTISAMLSNGKTKWRPNMIWNYLTVGFRNLRRHTFYSLLNILGLAVGIACMLLAVLYVGYQFRFDQHHEKSDRIYRVIRKIRDVSGERYDLGTKPVAPHLRDKFPEVEAVTRMLVREMWASNEDRGFNTRVCITDAEMFDIFTLPMVVGDPKTGLNDPHTAFLSQTLAHKLFGDDDPIDKTVNIHYKWFKGDFTVTGILKESTKDIK